MKSVRKLDLEIVSCSECPYLHGIKCTLLEKEVDDTDKIHDDCTLDKV